MKRSLAILGSTGSIGTSALDVVRALDGRLEVRSLAARTSAAEMAEQVREFGPARVAMVDASAGDELRSLVGESVEILTGEQALVELARDEGADVVVSAVVGAAGLRPALSALSAGKTLAIANKEPLVAAGELMVRAAEAGGGTLLPVDSEHSAIFQAMRSGRPSEVRRLIITASGGPFRTTRTEELASVTPEQALAHPTWSMGPKITVDSATMMNKALEVVEARWLFGVDADRIEVWVHPQSIVHSIVEFIDGSMVAQMGVPDMRLPIQYALSYPERLDGGLRAAGIEEMRSLTFERPDPERFPAVALGHAAAAAGGTMGAVLSAANEVAVDRFLGGGIGFTEIAATVSRTMDAHGVVRNPDLDDILEADGWARERAGELCAESGPARKGER